MDQDDLERLIKAMIATAIREFKTEISSEQMLMHEENKKVAERHTRLLEDIRLKQAREEGEKAGATKANRVVMAVCSALGAGVVAVVAEIVKHGLGLK